METLEFSLIRKYFNEKYTIGKILADQEYLCDSLEPPVRDLHDYNHDGDFMDEGEGKVYGNTAIPYGRYLLKFTYWTKHQKMTLELKDVPGFTGILIHAGATVKDTMACILAGENKIKGGLLYSRYHVNIIEDMAREAMAAGKDCYITIKA